MSIIYETDLTLEECQAVFHENVDYTPIHVGYEKLSGKMTNRRFTISYQSGKIRLNNAVFVKVRGRITERKGKTIVTCTTYKGLTDPGSLALLFVGTLVIVAIATGGQLHVPGMILITLLWCILVSGTTFVISWLSAEADEGEALILDFLKRNLKLKTYAE